MSKDPRHALHELREYFEQKRNLHIRKQAELSDETSYQAERATADAYNHAMEMVVEYLRAVEKR